MTNPFQTDASPHAADTRMWTLTDGETPEVGRICRFPGKDGRPTGEASYRFSSPEEGCKIFKIYEMARSYTRERVWVPEWALKPYPSSPIPDPSPRPLALLDAAGQYGGPG